MFITYHCGYCHIRCDSEEEALAHEKCHADAPDICIERASGWVPERIWPNSIEVVDNTFLDFPRRAAYTLTYYER